uniref:RNA polymerase sigma factor n=2 Tax=uncultured Bacteroides sp. TaxID=162156 RepID=UPI0025F9B3A8|nr:sigma-70 family RNA polymerase sigma factor [uncultured Bacteroides sp.]
MEMDNIPSSGEIDDLALWNLLIKGDQKALEILYQKYYSLLLNYGLKCNPNKELIKDCIQDLFVNLYQNSSVKTDNITVRSYLLKALRNNLLYKLSSQKEENSLDESVFHIPENEDLFEQLFPKNDQDVLLARRLMDAVSQLTPNQKSVLYLRYVKELSYKEIADVMDMNVQSSMNLANRALTKLRSLIGQDEHLLGLWQLLIIKMVLSL